jgi:hypothetical protein
MHTGSMVIWKILPTFRKKSRLGGGDIRRTELEAFKTNFRRVSNLEVAWEKKETGDLCALSCNIVNASKICSVIFWRYMWWMMKIQVFWPVTPCWLVSSDNHISWCLHGVTVVNHFYHKTLYFAEVCWDIRCVWFSLEHLLKTVSVVLNISEFLLTWMNACWSACKLPVIIVSFWSKLECVNKS